MNRTVGGDPHWKPLAASGIHVIHHAWRPDGTFEQHEGGFDECPALECQWPRLGGLVTITSGDRQVTGVLKAKSTQLVTIETADGTRYWASLAAAQAPEWGVYCPHGTKLIEAEVAEHICHLPKEPCDDSGKLGHLCIDHQPVCHGCYPVGRKILPWACEKDGCSEAAFDREQQEMEEQCWEELRSSLYG